MSAPLEADFYGNILSRMNYSSAEYYLTGGTSENQFNGDPELKTAFIEVRDAMDRFIELLFDRIDEAGGYPESYLDKGAEKR